MLSSADVTRLLAADARGLVPDPWRQTGILCAAIANFALRPPPTAATWEDFVPMVRDTGQDFDEVYRQRKAAHGGS